MKVLEFKCISPFFEQERDGEKPFDIRKWDGKDKRFRALAQWNVYSDWWIRFVHPSGQTFLRRLQDWNNIRLTSGSAVEPRWIIMYLGDPRSATETKIK